MLNSEGHDVIEGEFEEKSAYFLLKSAGFAHNPPVLLLE